MTNRTYLLNGRLRSVDWYPENDSMFKYRDNKNMKPDWRNQMWTHQNESKPERDPVVSVLKNPRDYRIGLSPWEYLCFY